MANQANNSPQIVNVFHALGDPNRFKIIRLLSGSTSLCVSEVALKVGITTAGVSQHMKILERVGLVKPKRMGQKICYQIDYKKNSAVLAFLDNGRA
jgi:DNA-binding transcriptional ArsR family regulator